ncbi:hypothetical protein [Pelagibaculum spongiae]|uniref:Uncharacterized protein n=1 Tax=Pelagibaculum spongiae TaxID=2080658 RepID=A0A2V1GXE7_9GAMM|nr:hypothetical protein [Pelagibaculum spongiae]PVZ70323.1 hypothetical protein DC094_06930 [Pelagibaculum spongiae]
MSFNTEPTGYIKTAVSDLQGAWENLKQAVADDFSFTDCDKLIFHIHEAMSWESVRNFQRMKTTLLLIENIASQTDAPEEVLFWLTEVRDSFNVVMQEIDKGNIQ